MSEKSYFHNGVGAGDAREAPYSGLVYALVRGLYADSAGARVFGQAATFLAVSPSAGLTVSVAAGAAFMYGVYVTTGATTTTLATNTSGMPRIDRVVLRVRWGDTPSATLGVLSGVPNSVPVIPELTQIPGDLYEMSLARVYVPSGLAAVTVDYIVDEREFYEKTTSYYAPTNMMPNSELMAQAGTSGTNGAAARGFAPAFWQLASATTSCAALDKFPQMERGSTAQVTCPNVNDGLQTTLPHLALSANIPVTIRLLIEVTKGEVWIDTAGGGANGVRVPVSNGPVEVILRRTFTAADTALELWIYNILATETIFRLGGVTVTHGLVGANYLPVRETLFFNMPVMHPLSTSVGSSGTFEIDIADFPISLGCSATIMRLEVSDTASNGTANLYTALEDPVNGADWLRCEVGNMPNTKRTVRQGLVGAPFDATTRAQSVDVTAAASGATQMTQEMYLLGCVT